MTLSSVISCNESRDLSSVSCDAYLAIPALFRSSLTQFIPNFLAVFYLNICFANCIFSFFFVNLDLQYSHCVTAATLWCVVHHCVSDDYPTDTVLTCVDVSAVCCHLLSLLYL